MGSRLWLLVEWVDESQMFGSYGVVNVNTSAYNQTDLDIGKEIFLSVTQGQPRRAKILRISENKRYVQEHQVVLERQDERVKKVLELCMRTIREVKSDNTSVMAHQHVNQASQILPPRIQYNPEPASKYIAPPHIVIASNANGSDSESEANSNTERRFRSFDNSTLNYPVMFNPRESRNIQMRETLNNTQHRPRPMVSSTPLSSSSGQQKFLTNQETQTDPPIYRPSLTLINNLETALKNLYKTFMKLVVRSYKINAAKMTESQRNQMLALMELNSATWRERYYTESENQEIVPPQGQVQVSEVEEVVEESRQDVSSNSSSEEEDESDDDSVNTVQRVRKTNQRENAFHMNRSSRNNDMVPLGQGSTKIPARVLNDVDWSSYTSATRQLLQALFPRRVLATHCLTGRQSPAFMGRPPKKILDPKLVEDIVKIVSTRCGVPKNLIRNTITIKCTDESKLYRKRLQRRLANQKDENIQPPPMLSSDESSNSNTLLN